MYLKFRLQFPGLLGLKFLSPLLLLQQSQDVILPGEVWITTYLGLLPSLLLFLSAF